MSKKYKIRYSSFGRWDTNFDGPIKFSHQNIWCQADQYLSNLIIDKGSVEAGIKICWEPLKNLILDKNHDEAVVECEVFYAGSSEQSSIILLDQYLELFLYHFFFVFNISSPGCYNYFQAEARLDENKVHENYLRAYALDSAWTESFINNWPRIQGVDLSQTLNWYKQVALNDNQIARSKVQKVLFSLAHICTGEQYDPTDLIWLAHALEALYSPPKSGITKTLQDRIFLVLGTPSVDKKMIKAKIRDFYQLRSRFVHGNMSINHPMGNEKLDYDVEELRLKILETTDFVLSIILATIEKLVCNNWIQLNFAEDFTGEIIV